jgi:methionine-R-sulfoxide reductase
MAYLYSCCIFLVLSAPVLADTVTMYRMLDDGSCGEAQINQEDWENAVEFGGLRRGSCTDIGFSEKEGAETVLPVSFVGTGPVTLSKMRMSESPSVAQQAAGFFSQFLSLGRVHGSKPKPELLPVSQDFRGNSALRPGSALRAMGKGSEEQSSDGSLPGMSRGSFAKLAATMGALPLLSPQTAIARSNGLGDLASALEDPKNSDSWRKKVPAKKVSTSGWALDPLKDEEIKKIVKDLPSFSQGVVLYANTERPFTGKALPFTTGGYTPGFDSTRKGVYVSPVSGLPLFKSSAKYDSGTGWPSFYEPYDPAHVIERLDPADRLYMPRSQRTEVLDARSGAHLGHVFDDGPDPTGKRYCMNAAALRFIPEEQFADYICSICQGQSDMGVDQNSIDCASQLKKLDKSCPSVTV